MLDYISVKKINHFQNLLIYVLLFQNVPHYYLSVDINVDKIKALKGNFDAFLEKENVKINMNDFVIKAVALACRKVPEANSSWQESFIRQ